MRDRNGTRTRAIPGGSATLRQNEHIQLGMISPLHLLRHSPMYLPQVNYNAKAKLFSFTPRGFNWYILPSMLQPQRLQQRNRQKRRVRQLAAEALQNVCAIRSGAKEVLACGAFIQPYQ